MVVIKNAQQKVAGLGIKINDLVKTVEQLKHKSDHLEKELVEVVAERDEALDKVKDLEEKLELMVKVEDKKTTAKKPSTRKKKVVKKEE